MLDVRRLLILLELQRRGTLAEVANALHLTPSAVSQQLSLLEKEVGVELLRKVGRGVQLTPAALTLTSYADQVLDLLEAAAIDVARDDSALTGSVKVAVFQSAALAFMPQVLSRLAAEHPSLRVTMTQREPETALRETWARDFDLVVAEQYPGHAAPWHPNLDRVELTSDALRLAVPTDPQALAGLATNVHTVSHLELETGSTQKITSLADTAKLPWVMEPRGAASRHWAEQVCRQAGFEPDVRFETADLQAHIALIASGNAVALLPGLMTVSSPANIRLLDLPGAPRRTLFTAVHEAAAERASIVELRRILTETAHALVA